MARSRFPEETRNRIISVAATLFVEKGYEKTTMQNILDDLGNLSKGAVYHHFASKEEILEAVVESVFNNFSAELELIREAAGLNGREKLEKLFECARNFPTREPLFANIPDFMENPMFLACYLKQLNQVIIPDYFIPAVKKGVQDGSLITDTPKELADFIANIAGTWLNPMMYNLSEVEQYRRCRLLNKMLSIYGIKVLEE